MEENNKFRMECLEAGEKFFEINYNYEQEIDAVYEYIEIQKHKLESNLS
ncbi:MULTISPECIES: hypothetical protein [unclassified Paenibacillus]